MGMQAGSLIGGAAQSGGSQAAGYQYGAGVNAASARREGWDALAGGLGEIYEGWQNGRAPAGKSAAAAVKTPMYPPNTNAFQRWGGRPAY
jgi:hypothetical protein